MTDRNKRIRNEAQARAVLELDRRAANSETRTVPAALSSETEYERWFGREVLVHEPAAVDLSRASGDAGLPLLFNHNADAIVGRIKDVRLVDGVLRGVLHFGRSADAEAKWADVKDGVLTDMSIGYRIQKWEESEGSDLVRVTRWTPLEASIVSVPADHTVGINRSLQLGDLPMSDNGTQPKERDGEAAVVNPVTTIQRDFKIAHAAGAKEAVGKERDRIRALDAIFDETDDNGERLIPESDLFRAIRARAVDEGWDELTTRREVMRANPMDVAKYIPVMTHRDQDLGVGQTRAPQPADQHRGGLPPGRIQAGTDEREKLAEIAEKAILVRSSIVSDPDMVREVRAAGFGDWSAFEIGAEMLRRSNFAVSGKSKRDLAGIMLGRAGSHANADFTSILANVATKSALRGWMEANTTWQIWCNVGSLPDFKPATIAGLGGFPDLDLIPRSGGPYNEHSMDDVHETAQLATYGALFSIGRQTLIDDDLGAFTRVPMKMGAAAARKINSLAYDRLINGTSETLTQDGVILFDASTHGNYITTGAAPSVTTLDVGFVAMKKQKSPARTGETKTDPLNIAPGYLIVPAALETTSRVLVNSVYDPAGTTASISRRDAPNPFNGRLEVVADAYLDLNSITAGWYLAAPKNGPVDTVTVFFLNGQQEPFLEQIDHSPNSDGVTYKVRMDAVAKPLDFRGLFYNDGA